MDNIRFLKRSEITDLLWNELINQSVNSLPYGLAWYLDAVAENWGALVLNDYQAAMPLVWLTKMGVKCLYQPYYCQQLGVFSRGFPAKELQKNFLKASADKFPYVNINLNPVSKIVANDLGLNRKKNLLLALNKNYDTIFQGYTQNHKRNIAKGAKNNLRFFEATDLTSLQAFYLNSVNHTKENFKPQHEKIFKTLTAQLVANNMAFIFSALNAEGNIVAAVLIIKHQKRLVGIINSSSVEGKSAGASHFLFNQIIKKYAGSDLVLDFEGSSIPTIARFYEGFGATEEVFFNYKTTILKSFSKRFG